MAVCVSADYVFDWTSTKPNDPPAQPESAAADAGNADHGAARHAAMMQGATATISQRPRGSIVEARGDKVLPVSAKSRARHARGRASNWRKCRRNTQASAIVHGPFDTTHNLKVVGSNPTPATISNKYIKCLACGIFIPQDIRASTSTPHQPHNGKTPFACTRTHRRALADNVKDLSHFQI